jgi:hypothetical protein
MTTQCGHRLIGLNFAAQSSQRDLLQFEQFPMDLLAPVHCLNAVDSGQ